MASAPVPPAPSAAAPPVPASAADASAPKRRGRPTAERIAAIEQAILAAGLGLFLELGYEATTMEAVAERAQVSKGTLYARYPGKEALFRKVIEDRQALWSQIAGAQDHLLPSQLAPRLRHHARSLRRKFDLPEFLEISRMIRSAAVIFPDIATFWHEIGTSHFHRFLARDMAETVGEIPGRTLDWDFLANLFLHGFAGWYTTESASRPVGEEEAAAYADKVIEAIVALIGLPDDKGELPACNP